MKERILVAASTYGHLLRFHTPYIDALRAAGHTVVTLAEAESDADVTAPFVKHLFSPRNFLAVMKIRKLLMSEHFDRILVHTTLAAFFVRLAVRMLPRRRRPFVVNTVHGYLFSDGRGLKNRLYLLAERAVRSVTDRVLVMNDEDLSIAEKYRLGREVRMIRGMGLPMRDIPQDAAPVRQKLGLSDGDRLLLFVGELSKRKNQSFLINVTAYLPENVYLALIGDGTEREVLLRAVAEKGLLPRILFVGTTDRVYDFLAAADVYVSAAKSEGLPFNIMEAMAAGLPIVATDVKGQRDLLRGSDATLCPVGDLSVFRAAVEEKLVSPRRVSYPALARYRLEAVFDDTMDGLVGRKEEE